MSDIARRIVGLSPEKRRALSQRLIKKRGAASGATIPRPPRDRGPLPLSFGQERLWFIAELETESSVYNTFYALRFRGALTVPALGASFLDVVGRHESLRTTFAAPDGKPIQVVHDAPAAFPLPVVALERLSTREREAAVQRLVAAAADPVFDLERGPLLRSVLMRLAPQEHVLLVVIHHIISDGWSLGVLVREVAAFYQARTTGRPSSLPELAIQYADFALWQRQWLRGEVLEEQLAYWRRQLAGAPPRLELPCDRPRSLRRSYRGTTLGLRLTPELTAALRTLSAEHGSTLYTTLLTGFAILLGRISGQSDVVVGSPVANRQRTELEGLIGVFTAVNTRACESPVTWFLSVYGPGKSPGKPPCIRVVVEDLRTAVRVIAVDVGAEAVVQAGADVGVGAVVAVACLEGADVLPASEVRPGWSRCMVTNPRVIAVTVVKT